MLVVSRVPAEAANNRVDFKTLVAQGKEPRFI